MSHLPWQTPYAHSQSSGGDSEIEALQTDVMRFMAILGLCLMAIFSLVQSLPYQPAEQAPQLESKEFLEAEVKQLEANAAQLQEKIKQYTETLQQAQEAKLQMQDAKQQVEDVKQELVLEARHESNGFGFPFDKPHVDFYTRLSQAYPILMKIKKSMKVSSSLLKLMPISKVLNDKALESTVTRIQERSIIFDRLRTAMRIAQPNATEGLNDEGDADIKTIKASVTQFRQDETLKQQALTQPAYQKMFVQIDRYWEKLFADPIEIKTPLGCRQIQPQRTNNIMEQFFRDIKRSYRKKSGNKSLTKILQTMMVDTPLVKNLNNPEYMKIILKGNTHLTGRFAEIDIKQVRQALSEEQKSTCSYPKKMRKLFKISDLLDNN